MLGALIQSAQRAGPARLVGFARVARLAMCEVLCKLEQSE